MPERENLFSTSKPLRGCNSDSRNTPPLRYSPPATLRVAMRAGITLMWSRKCGQVLPFVSRRGLMIVARQFIAWKRIMRIRPRRARSDPYPGLIGRPNRGAPIGPNHTVPTGRLPVFAPIPGNKLPGYFHNVPTGQRHLTPVHEFDSTSNPRSRARNSRSK